MPGFNIAYLSSDDPKNKRLWSGSHYSIYKTLQKHVGTVAILGPYRPKLAIFAGRAIAFLTRKLTGKNYNYWHSKMVSKRLAAHFEKKLKEDKYDLIVAPAASAEIAYLRTSIPVVYISDSTFKLSLNYHKQLTNLTAASAQEGNTTEANALRNSSIIVVSSPWAAQSVINDYKTDPAKVLVAPFGPNMEFLPSTIDAQPSAGPLTLLFIAVYWDNKGGDIAYNCVKELNRRGVETKLIVCGCTPPPHVDQKFIELIPFLDKNSADDQKELAAIFRRSHFVILPTRFDCTPIVFCEASAFGVPSVSANTGGVGGHIREGVNGFLVDYNDAGNGYADVIETAWKNRESYLALRKSSRTYYEEKLNWNTWGTEVRKAIDRLFAYRSN